MLDGVDAAWADSFACALPRSRISFAYCTYRRARINATLSAAGRWRGSMDMSVLRLPLWHTLIASSGCEVLPW